MKIQVQETEGRNMVSFENIEDGGAFIAPSGSVCIKSLHAPNDYILFDDMDGTHSVWVRRTRVGNSIEPKTMVEPVEIKSINIEIIRSSRS